MESQETSLQNQACFKHISSLNKMKHNNMRLQSLN